jgi:SAM-dependent methyltransferase
VAIRASRLRGCDSRMKTTTVCPICSIDSAEQPYVVKEQMIGTNEPFAYVRCSACAARRLLDIPADMSRYYPDSYIAFQLGARGWFRTWFRRYRNAGYFRWNAGAPIRWLRPDGALAALARVPLGRDERVVDVGCGSGLELHRLAELGFRHLTGIDPFIPDAVAGRHADGVTVLKVSLDDFRDRGIADLAFANHVFEHVADPIGFLRGIARLLTPGKGRCLLRTPIANSWAAENYGPHWVQHDAPRHLVIHTEESLRLAAQQAGLRVARVWYDSTAFQFWGSEAYQRGDSLLQTFERRKAHSLRLLWNTTRERARAAMLNRNGKGDQACFVLEPA